ncbi:hypothetical protein [Companilactobacillus sp. FL22-1]|uniref:hypothetical protein n=1 Tax=Companilactobacillus sp. FL22-1 TaxID=3373892 RepID=UPI003754950F
MKKIIWLIMGVMLLSLSSCTNQSPSSAPAVKTIRQNKTKWNRRLRQAVDLDKKISDQTPTIPPAYDDSSMSWQRLTAGNQLLVKAQVVNLQPELGRLVTETKATIYIEKVISGDKSWQGKTIKTEFSGGLARVKDYVNVFTDKDTTKDFGFDDPNTIIRASDPSIPMPQIGQKIIIGLNRFRAENENQKKMYQHFGLSRKNFFVINNPQVTYWTQESKTYRLNNPAFLKGNLKKYPNLKRITERLNNF